MLKNKYIGFFLFLLSILILGFFIYPTIIYQKDEESTTPSAPLDFDLSLDNNQIYLAWGEPSNDGGYEITGYTIVVVDSYGTQNAYPVGVREYSYSIILSPGLYSVFMYASNENGDGENSRTIDFRINDIEIPLPPENISILSGENFLDISWDESFSPEDFPILSYVILIKEKNSDDEFLGIDIKSNDTSYRVEDLQENTEYEIMIYATNEVGNSENSGIVIGQTSGSGSGDQEVFEISDNPNVSVTSNSAIITWTTSKAASSMVVYGPIDELGYSTAEMNTTQRVTSHSVTVNNLLSCTVYIYKVISYDASNNIIEGQSDDFITSGCKGNAEVISYSKDISTNDSGASIELKDSGRGILISAPANVVSGSNLVIQALKVSRDQVVSQISKPLGKNWVGHSYVLNAIDDSNSYVSSFEKNVSVSIDYLNEEVEGIDVNSLKIWHYEDGAGWRSLNSCSTSINGLGGTVTCLTNSFSVFGLFGDSLNGGGDNQGDSSQQEQQNQQTGGNTTTSGYIPNQNQVVEIDKNNIKYLFNKNLWYGLKDIDVLLLQKFLNSSGFIVSDVGPGSPGKETLFFGSKTKQALIKFQEHNKGVILIPAGLNFGTGFFGPFTRNFINSLNN